MPDSSLFLPVRFQDLLIGIHQRFQGVDFISCDSNGRKGFTRDGVTQCAAVEINKTQVQFFCMTRQKRTSSLLALPGPTWISPPGDRLSDLLRLN